MFNFQRTDRVCQICKKIFCCQKCCDRHVLKVHPNVNTDCPLCAGDEVLSIRQCNCLKLNCENKKLLQHVADKHLPLQCRLCGALFESREDLKSIAACKWFKLWHGLTSSSVCEYQEKKLKPYSIISDISDYNGSRFFTPPEIYRKTSTPMFDSQKISFETPCVSKFILKTPKTNSPSITQVTSISDTNSTRYFSFLLTSNDEITPFRTCRNLSEHQLPKNNSRRDLNISYEKEKIIDDNAVQVSSPVEADLATLEGDILQNSPQSDVCEDVIKKVRFSEQYKTATEISEFSENFMESCVQNILYTSEGEEEELHDARNESTQKAKVIAENIKDRKDIITKNNKDVNDEENTMSTNDSQEKVRMRFLTEPSENFTDNPQSTAKERDSKRLLMMVLVESNSGELSNDLMPLINSGLKKLQEQLISANRQSSPSSDPKPGKVCRRSITTMKMSVSSIESFSPKSTATVTNHEQFASSSSSSSPVQTEKNNSTGFLSTVTQAMKQALKSFSGLKMPSTSIEATKVMRREVIEELTSSQEPSCINPARPGKRTREVFEESSKENPFTLALETKSPLAKRQRGWYKMIKGRQPINRMRDNRVTTSPRGVSTGRQVFRQGSLTVGDTVLPLPTRAHQSTD